MFPRQPGLCDIASGRGHERTRDASLALRMPPAINTETMMKNARSIGTPAKKTKAARARKSSPAKARSSKRQARKVKPPTAPASVAAKGVEAIAPVAADATANPKKSMNTKQQSYEIPSELRDFAEKSVEQARKAIDGFMGAQGRPPTRSKARRRRFRPRPRT